LSSVSIEDLTREAQERIRQQRAEQSEDSK